MATQVFVEDVSLPAGMLLYTRTVDPQDLLVRQHLKIAPLPYVSQMDFRLHYDGAGPSFPLHFHYGDLSDPPVWAK